MEKSANTKPIRCSQLSFSKKVALIIDWLEIFWNDRQIYEPEQLVKLQTEEHSESIALNSQGAAAFVSETWEGHVRYKHTCITEHSGILIQSLPGDVMSDRDLTLHNQLGLCKPACTYQHSQRERTSSLQLRRRNQDNH